MSLRSINPADGTTLAVYETMTGDEASDLLDRVRIAQRSWRLSAPSARAERLRATAEQLRDGRRELAELITREMGKPMAESVAEIDKCALGCEYYADHAQDFLAPEAIATGASRSYVAFEPVGVVLAIMPWNFPFWQVFRCAAPAIAAGNAVLLKHAETVTGCALAIERVMVEAGFPEDLLRAALVEVPSVGPLIADARIAAVTLTGSTRAGRAVASAAGSALKKVVLELGGSDPYLILEDADLEATIEACATARLLNAGQSCIAAKRFIVVRAIRDDFEARLARRFQACRIGVDIGPLARADLRETLHAQVTASVERGARCLLGGELPSGPGFRYPPTVLTDVAPGMPAHDEELFGPVAAIVPADDEAHAVELANRTAFGLGAAVFTRDVARGERIARHEIDAGSCFVNDFVRSDPRLPFGGVKASGYGRELGSYGIREFVNVKTVWVA